MMDINDLAHDRLGAWIGVGLCLLSAGVSVAGLYLVAGWFL